VLSRSRVWVVTSPCQHPLQHSSTPQNNPTLLSSLIISGCAIFSGQIYDYIFDGSKTNLHFLHDFQQGDISPSFPITLITLITNSTARINWITTLFLTLSLPCSQVIWCQPICIGHRFMSFSRGYSTRSIYFLIIYPMIKVVYWDNSTCISLWISPFV